VDTIIPQTYRKNFTWLVILLAMMMFSSVANAQFYNGSNMTFGKNRVQFEEFRWQYYKFDDYDTYFYENGVELAQFAAKYAQEQIPIMENKIESAIDKRIQFIVFNNLTDLKQSNIGLMTETSYNTGGITHIIGSRVFLYFDGNHVNFQEQIRAGIAEVMFNQMMFGGTLGQQVKSATFFSIPDWYKVGIISYLSNEWDVDFDNHVRDGILSGRYKKVNNIEGPDAVYAGHSLWRFIAMQYGRAAVSNIIHMTSVSNSIDKGFLYVIGRPFKELVKEWRAFYVKEYEGYVDNENHPENVLPVKFKKDIIYQRPHISPFGKYLAYTSNELGKYKIFIYDLVKGKKKRIYKRGVMIDTKTDYSYPLLAWHPTGKMLAFLIEAKGRPYLYLYNMEKKKLTRQTIYEVQKITDMSYSDNGRFLLMSAVKQGQSDIFVFNIAASSFTRITDDIYSEIGPKFINNSSQIVFSSNRVNDTLTIVPEEFEEIPENFDLFAYDYINRDPILRRLTNTPLANEMMPDDAGFNTITYLSDESGIYNAYMAVIDSTVSSVDTTIHYRYFTHSKPITNYTRNIISHNTSVSAGKRSFIYFEDNIYKVYSDNIPDFSNLPEMELPKTNFMSVLTREYEKEQARLEKLKQKEELAEGQDEPVKEEKITRMKQFRMVYVDNKGNETIGKPKGRKRGIEGYPLLAGEDIGTDEDFKIPKRLLYRTEYYLNDVISQIDFNYLNYNYQPFTGGGGPVYLNAGFNFFIQLGINDLMEDHRFAGAFRFDFSFRNNEYLFSYANLKRRLDREIVYHRYAYENVYSYPWFRMQSNELFYILTYPFTEALALKGTVSFRNENYSFLATDQITLEAPNIYYNWLSVRGALVFDNTRSLGLNLYKGTRYKFFAEYYNRVGVISEYKFLPMQDKFNLTVLGFDIRHYTRIHRNFIWANRIAGSTSFGDSPLIYYMGGVDNWMFPKFDMETPIDYSMNYAYQTLATNMRGFIQNIRNGNSFVVINSELRFPIVQYFSKSPVSSSFLRNLQLLAFADIGTAWTGPNPYSDENSLYTRYVSSGPLLISVEVQKEPIVGGFGFGARIHLLGYFIRGDVAWGVEDYEINKPVWYLSLSLDF
jgi:Tol biopolymer transport system component